MWQCRINNRITKIILKMKKVIFVVIFFTAIGLTNVYSQIEMTNTNEQLENTKVSTVSFGARGNCGMCKKTIESAAKGIDGVSEALWDKDQKKIIVSFDVLKTTEIIIHNAIAASGYDTEKVKGNIEAYNNLPGCCKYDREMKMNQTFETKKDDHNGHKH